MNPTFARWWVSDAVAWLAIALGAVGTVLLAVSGWPGAPRHALTPVILAAATVVGSVLLLMRGAGVRAAGARDAMQSGASHLTMFTSGVFARPGLRGHRALKRGILLAFDDGSLVWREVRSPVLVPIDRRLIADVRVSRRRLQYPELEIEMSDGWMWRFVLLKPEGPTWRLGASSAEARIISMALRELRGDGASCEQSSDIQTDSAELRPLARKEAAVLRTLLSQPFDGRVELVEQVAGLRVGALDEQGSLRLQTSGGSMSAAAYRVPVEASYTDADGVVAHVLLHVLNGRLHELEVYREDGGQVLTSAAQAGDLRAHEPSVEI
ncbi:MAG: DUF6984 family protein [Actinomycetota bacterium]